MPTTRFSPSALACFCVATVGVFIFDLADARLRRSQEKCEEFAALVYDIEVSPVLRVGIDYKHVSRCGIVETPLIIGGVKAKLKEFPHMVVIGYGKNVTDLSWQCGGTLISENYVLTAAHCIESPEKGPAVMVRAGITNLNDPESTMQKRIIAERIKHPKYKPPSKYNDIALLKLARAFYLNADIRPACLQVEEIPISEKTALACGFGKTSYEHSEGSKNLMMVRLEYVPKEQCEKTFGPIIGRRQMTEGMVSSQICAGVMEGGKDTCQGDSGGPLQRVLHEPYCMYSVVGVTSFGKFCGFKNSPAIYTRVSSYIDWIESIVWP